MSDKPCPNCGHCDKCGRSNFRPWNPYPWTTPIYPGTNPYPYRVGDFWYSPYPYTTWGQSTTSSGTNITSWNV